MRPERLGIRDTFLALLTILDRCEVDHAFIGALPVLAWGRTRGFAGEPLDWGFLDHWAAEWGIEAELRPYRERFA